VENKELGNPPVIVQHIILSLGRHQALNVA